MGLGGLASAAGSTLLPIGMVSCASAGAPATNRSAVSVVVIVSDANVVESKVFRFIYSLSSVSSIMAATSMDIREESQ